MYLIGIDGGATKTLGRLTTPKGEVLAEHSAGPSSLTYDRDGAKHTLHKLVLALIAQAQVNPFDQLVICAGLAGAADPSGNAAVTEHLQALGEVLITTDAHTAAVGANGGKPVTAVSIGTGSVALALGEDGSLEQFGGWGFPIGDEGGGAWIGWQALKQALHYVDSGRTPKERCYEAVLAHIGPKPADWLQWLRGASGTKFATLAPVVVSQAEQGEPIAQALMQAAADEIEALVARVAHAHPEKPVMLLGGLARPMQPYFSEAFVASCRPPLGSSLDGACLLARQQLPAGEGILV